MIDEELGHNQINRIKIDNLLLSINTSLFASSLS